jgi:hypothetical protein
MRTWLGPVVAAAKSAQDQQQAAVQNAAATPGPGTVLPLGIREADPASRADAGAEATAASQRGLLGWWHRWWG